MKKNWSYKSLSILSSGLLAAAILILAFLVGVQWQSWRQIEKKTEQLEKRGLPDTVAVTRY